MRLSVFHIPVYVVADGFCRSVHKNGEVLSLVSVRLHHSPVYLSCQVLNEEPAFESNLTRIHLKNFDVIIATIYRSPSSNFELFLIKKMDLLEIIT
jgi:hypothetical protein